MGGTGLEHPADSSGKTSIGHDGGAKSGAVRAQPAKLRGVAGTCGETRRVARGVELDVDLTAIVDAWPTLPAAVRAAMMALVEAAGRV